MEKNEHLDINKKQKLEFIYGYYKINKRLDLEHKKQGDIGSKKYPNSSGS